MGVKIAVSFIAWGGVVIEKDFNLTKLIVLVLKSVDGDIYETLIDACKPIIYKAIGSRYISGYDQDDLFQEASIVLMKSIESYRFETDMRFQQYFSRCLMNHLNSLGRKSIADKRKSMNDAISMDYFTEVTGTEFSKSSRTVPYLDPADEAIAQESFKEYASKLSKFEMEVFKLYLKNHSFLNIASTLDEDVDKVKSAVYRCSNKLRKTFY